MVAPRQISYSYCSDERGTYQRGKNRKKLAIDYIAIMILIRIKINLVICLFIN